MNTDLIKLKIFRLSSFFGWKTEIDKAIPFPEKIHDLHLVKDITVNKHYQYYKNAIYKSDNKKTYFAKMWAGKKKNLTYYWLKNEINLNRIINQADNSNRKHSPPHNRRVHVPQLCKVFEDDQRLIMVSEYIDAKHLYYCDNKKRLHNIQKVLQYLDLISNRITDSDKSSIQTIKPLDIIAIFPILVLLALQKYPKFSALIIKGSWQFLIGLGLLFKNYLPKLTHRDLGPNIILNNHGVYILDFQISSFTYPELDLIALEICFWRNDSFIKDFHNSNLIKNIYSNPELKNKYKLLSIYSILFEMAIIHNLTPELSKSYLKHAVHDL